MTVKYMAEYRDGGQAKPAIEAIRNLSRRDVRFMEVCGTHTVSIFRSGIRSVLPPTISLLSGPGCPVCVTAQTEVDAFVALAQIDGVIITTFGDLVRVPGTESSLEEQRAQGRDIRIVYSTMDALQIARDNPKKQVVFLGVGFETTAPTIAAALLTASRKGPDNFLVYAAHKRVPPALDALMAGGEAEIDGFILPGHVSVMIGLNAYRPFFERFKKPCVVAGFEPLDILQAVLMLVRQVEENTPKLENGYGRAVTEQGNPKAIRILDTVFKPADAEWRGIGTIPNSGLEIRTAFAANDARKQFTLKLPEPRSPKGCACGEVLTGAKTPPDCALFKSRCSPETPVGACMVSSEGTCAAYYRYHNP